MEYFKAPLEVLTVLLLGVALDAFAAPDGTRPHPALPEGSPFDLFAPILRDSASDGPFPPAPPAAPDTEKRPHLSVPPDKAAIAGAFAAAPRVPSGPTTGMTNRAVYGLGVEEQDLPPLPSMWAGVVLLDVGGEAPVQTAGVAEDNDSNEILSKERQKCSSLFGCARSSAAVIFYS